MSSYVTLVARTMTMMSANIGPSQWKSWAVRALATTQKLASRAQKAISLVSSNLTRCEFKKRRKCCATNESTDLPAARNSPFAAVPELSTSRRILLNSKWEKKNISNELQIAALLGIHEKCANCRIYYPSERRRTKGGRIRQSTKGFGTQCAAMEPISWN